MYVCTSAVLMPALVDVLKLTRGRVKTQLGDSALKQLIYMYMVFSAGCALRAITLGGKVKKVVENINFLPWCC